MLVQTGAEAVCLLEQEVRNTGILGKIQFINGRAGVQISSGSESGGSRQKKMDCRLVSY